MSEKEIVTLKREEISTIVSSWPFDKPQLGFIKIIRETNCCDCEDGGGDYTLIIKRVSDDRYFEIGYQGWDIDNDFEDFEDEVELKEVTPKQKTITVYE